MLARLGNYYRRVAKRGHNKAIVAVARMLCIIYHMLRKKGEHRGKNEALIEKKAQILFMDNSD